jgi:hypothetical protein
MADTLPRPPPESGPRWPARAWHALAGLPLRRLLAAAAVLLLVLAGLAAVNLAWRISRNDTLRFPGAVQRVVVDVEAGDVLLEGAARNDVLVLRTRQYALLAPKVDARVQGGVLRLAARCPALSVGCVVDQRIFLPPTLPVSVHTGSGAVSIADLRAPAQIQTGSGDVNVSDVRGRVAVGTGSGDVALSGDDGAIAATTSSGDITCNGVAGELAARTGSGHLVLDDIGARVDGATGSGDVDGAGLHTPDVSLQTGSGDLVLAFDAPATRIAARTGSGDITLTVPQAPYRLDLASDSGATRVSGIAEVPDAPRSISARSGAGDVTLRRR